MTVLSAARGETGSGTVWVLLAVLAVGAAATGSTLVASAAAARSRAAAAADLAALAGATHLRVRGPDGDLACSAARAVAARNGAGLRTCTVSPTSGTVEVVVEVRRTQGLLARVVPAAARARAGPAAPSPSP